MGIRLRLLWVSEFLCAQDSVSDEQTHMGEMAAGVVALLDDSLSVAYCRREWINTSKERFDDRIKTVCCVWRSGFEHTVLCVRRRSKGSDFGGVEHWMPSVVVLELFSFGCGVLVNVGF